MCIIDLGVERRRKFSYLVFLVSFEVITCKKVTPVPLTVTMCYVIPKCAAIAVDEIEAESQLIA